MREACKFNVRIHNGNILMSSVTKDPGVSSISTFQQQRHKLSAPTVYRTGCPGSPTQHKDLGIPVEGPVRGLSNEEANE
jgi:hypothetical protein